MTKWHRCKSCKLLSYPFCKCSSSHNTVWNISSNLNSLLHKLPVRKSKIEQLIDSKHSRSCICTSSSHTCCYRYELIKVYLYSTRKAILIFHKLVCFIYEIILINRKKLKININPYIVFWYLINYKTVIYTYCLHNHSYIVISIISLS